jgi:hypothetical protein
MEMSYRVCGGCSKLKRGDTLKAHKGRRSSAARWMETFVVLPGSSGVPVAVTSVPWERAEPSTC